MVSANKYIANGPPYFWMAEEKVRMPTTFSHRCYPHLIMVVFECYCDPESYAGGSVASGRATQAGHVEG
jgi:hypothetical protein